MKRWILNKINSRRNMERHLQMMAQHLLKCADTIDYLRAENMALRIRGEHLATSIECNDWTPDSAMRMSDCLASWREFEESSYETN